MRCMTLSNNRIIGETLLIFRPVKDICRGVGEEEDVGGGAGDRVG